MKPTTPRLRHAVMLLALAAASAHATDAPPPAAVPAAATGSRTDADARELVRSLLVKSPYRMSAQALAGTIRYRFALTPALTWRWPMTGEQVVRDGIEMTTLTVCRDCGIEPAPDAATLATYLAPNAWVQSDAREVRAFARTHVARGNDVDHRMRALADAVQKHMTGPTDFNGYHDAVTALRTRGGDCTEFAVLLAALGRARDIPTRLAYGIAYSSRFTGESHVFSPHVWVQAWDGKRWRSYDAGLGRFDAGHIALFVGDGGTDGLPAVTRAIARLRIVDAAGIVAPEEAPAPDPSPAP
ncbi:transglutaminase-like domain-containing protein [Montanilutibacter psychrotolerans]|uniref:transglutaminase-like domain-containing protein n=1 Tax=Montanilutibacter psychrotolerans TaxID=1327343 RepID=UPI001680B5DA|nr:transglutaminase-like domain-containing protein [Lysobacter psychrotolerans]